MQICTSPQTDNRASTPPVSFYRPDALPAIQPTAPKQWRQVQWFVNLKIAIIKRLHITVFIVFYCISVICDEVVVCCLMSQFLRILPCWLWHCEESISLMMCVLSMLLCGLLMPSVLWRCWLGGRKGIQPVKNWVVGCWRGCLGWGADLHTAQQMPLPLTISCSSKSRLVLTFLVLPFWYLLTRVVPGILQKSSKTVVCVCYVIYYT